MLYIHLLGIFIRHQVCMNPTDFMTYRGLTTTVAFIVLGMGIMATTMMGIMVVTTAVDIMVMVETMAAEIMVIVETMAAEIMIMVETTAAEIMIMVETMAAEAITVNIEDSLV